MNASNMEQEVLQSFQEICQHKCRQTNEMSSSEKAAASENAPGARGLFLMDYSSLKSKNFANASFLVGQDQMISNDKRNAWNSLTEIQKYSIGLVAHLGFDSYEESIITKAFIIKMQDHFNDSWYVNIRGNRNQESFFQSFYKSWLCIKQKHKKFQGNRNNSSYLRRKRPREDECSQASPSYVYDENEEGEVNPSEIMASSHEQRHISNALDSDQQSPAQVAINANDALLQGRAQFSPIKEDQKEENPKQIPFNDNQLSEDAAPQNIQIEPKKESKEISSKDDQQIPADPIQISAPSQVNEATLPAVIVPINKEPSAQAEQGQEMTNPSPFMPKENSNAVNPKADAKTIADNFAMSLFATPTGKKDDETPGSPEEDDANASIPKKGGRKKKSPSENTQKNSRNTRSKK